MLYTSAEAAKLLKKLNEEKFSLENKENQGSTFTAAITEDIEMARPEYSYEETQAGIEELDAKIRTVKHAINTFNLTHEIPDFGMTIDQALIYIPQLSARKSRLASMKERLSKERDSIKPGGIIEYTYTNYDVKKASEDYYKVTDELAKLQTALDVMNNSVKFEIEV